MMPAIHSMRFAVRPSRSDLMIGMPPPTAPSNATMTPFFCAAAKISLPCCASKRLVRGHDVLAVLDGLENQVARDPGAADQLDDDVDVGSAHDLERVVGDDRRARRPLPRTFSRSLSATILIRMRAACAAADLFLVALQHREGAAAYGADAEQPHVDGSH